MSSIHHNPLPQALRAETNAKTNKAGTHQALTGAERGAFSKAFQTLVVAENAVTQQHIKHRKAVYSGKKTISPNDLLRAEQQQLLAKIDLLEQKFKEQEDLI